MPTREEIIRRAEKEFDGMLTRHRARLAEIERQERATLTGLPGGAAALEAHQAERTAVLARYEKTLARLDATLPEAEQDAATARFDDESAVIAAYNDAVATAATAYATAVDEAEAAYQAAYERALRLVGPPRDAARTAAYNERQRVRAAAAARQEQDLTDAAAQQQNGLDNAREKGIAAVEALHGADALAREQAAKDRDASWGHADRRLGIALGRIELAAPVIEAFQAERTRAIDEAEREKDAFHERLRKELAELPQG